MDRNNRQPYWCIAKSAAIRKCPDITSEEVGRIKFGRQVTSYGEKPEIVNGRIKINFRDSADMNKKKPSVTGWVAVKALTDERVMDFAGLYFDNKTGKKLPVAKRYKGAVTGFVLPGEQVSLYAMVGEWCLTNRGWTKSKWLTKNTEIFDMESVSELFYRVLELAVHDYQNAVRKIKQHRYRDADDFCLQMWRINNIILWFISDEYAMMYDSVPGEERLDDINASLGIDKKWLKEKNRILDEITCGKGMRRQRNDSDRRHSKSGWSAQKHRSVLPKNGYQNCQKKIGCR